MPTLNITKNYSDGTILLEADLDAVIADVETFVNITKLDDSNLQSGGITASLKFANGSVTNAKMAADSVGTAQLVDASVTSAKIADDSVTTAKIADSAVTTAKIADGSISTVKLADSSVTKAKLASHNSQLSASSGLMTSTVGDTETDITNASITLTTSGRPVMLMLQSDASGNKSEFLLRSATTTTEVGDVTVRLYRDTTEISNQAIQFNPNQVSGFPKNVRIPPSIIAHLDEPAAGSYTYKATLQHSETSTLANTVANYARLVAYEL